MHAGAALGPRFSLLPHPSEYKALSQARERLRQHCHRADVIVTTHYHFDHFSPGFNSDFAWTWSSKEVAKEIYLDKTILAKNPKENINYAQQLRAWYFWRFLDGKAKEVKAADSTTFQFGDTRVAFSRPVPHGEEQGHLGFVLIPSITYSDEKFVFAPDVQGPMVKDTTDLIVNEKPDLLFVGGPPSYLVPSSLSKERLDRAVQSITEVVAVVNTTVIDHHLMRSEKWRDEIEGAFTVALTTGNELFSAAKYEGLGPILLEARRRDLYSEMPVSKEFAKWIRKKPEERRRIPPPI